MLLYIPFNDFFQCRDFNTFLLSTVNHYSLKKFLKCFKSHERELPLREATVMIVALDLQIGILKQLMTYK